MIVVTGASGFVGRHLVSVLRAHGENVRAVVRPGSEPSPGAATARLDRADDWPQALKGADAVVHLAAHNPAPGDRRAHADVDAFRSVNVDGTALVAEQTARAGVARFVFMSSIRVYGSGTVEALSEDTPLTAEDPYGRSKREAEAALTAQLSGTATTWTILRPPMIYGPGRGAIPGLLHRIIRSGLPVPLPQPDVPRSLIYIGNATAAVAGCLASETAADQTFNICDGPALGYRELAELIGEAIGRKPRFLRLPSSAIRLARPLPLAGPLVHRMSMPSVCDDSRIRDRLGWAPPFTTREGLRLTFATSRS